MSKWLFVMVLLLTACSGSTTTTSSDIPPAPSTTVDATTEAAEPPETTVPTMRSIEVAIPTEGLDLAGTLRLPAGESPAPAVVLIHGSGPQSRASEIPGQLNMVFGFDIPVFAELADALQESGFAALTYDKRSCGSFNGCADNGYPLPSDDLTIEAFIDDARATVDFLRRRPEIDPDRVSIVGHSQGAQFVTSMLESDPNLARGVMIAGPYHPIHHRSTARVHARPAWPARHW